MRRLIFALILASPLLVLPGHRADAFQNYCYGSSSDYSMGCFVPGGVFHWCFDEGGLQLDGDALTAAQDASATWNAYQPYVEFVYDGPCIHELANYNLPPNPFFTPAFDGESQVTFVYDTSDTAFGHTCADGFCGCLAPGHTCHGAVTEADILINVYGIDFDAQQNNIDPFYEDVVMHEFGHVLGLGHNGNGQGNNATYGIQNPCSANPEGVMCVNTLGFLDPFVPQADDITGLVFIYGDVDSDGCTGLEELSGVEHLGGGNSWDGTHRTDRALLNKHRDFPDINTDKQINSIDQALLAQKYGQHTGAPEFVSTRYDQNGDGIINSIDQAALAMAFGDTCVGGPN